MKRIKLLMISTLLSLGVAEWMARTLVVETVQKELFDMTPIESVAKLAWYKDWRMEHSRLARTFQPYEIYKQKPFDGHYIKISPEGYRYHFKREKKSGHLPHIALFGGSLVWGSGARGAHTLFSELERALKETQLSYQVDNFAEVGFVSSQSLMRMTRLLYSGQLPHKKLVFFAAPNDMASAVFNFAKGENHPEGLLWEEEKYRHMFQLGRTGEVSTLDIVRKLKSFRLLETTFASALNLPERDKGSWREPSEKQLAALSKKVASRFASIVETTSLLGKAYGKEVVVVLPPLLWNRTTPSEEEKKTMSANKRWEQYFTLCQKEMVQALKQKSHTVYWVDWSHALNDEKGSVFMDLFHLTEQGNKKIAHQLDGLLSDKSKASLRKL